MQIALKPCSCYNIPMTERTNPRSIKEDWGIITSTGCSDFRELIAGKGPHDFDPVVLRESADYILEAPPDTQVSPKNQI